MEQNGYKGINKEFESLHCFFLALAQNIREPSTQAKQLSLLDKKESWTF